MPGKDKLVRGMRMYVGGYNLSGDSLEIGALLNTLEEVDMSGEFTSDVRSFLAGRRKVGVEGYKTMMNDAVAGAFTILNSGDSSRLSVLFGSNGADPVIGDPAYLLGSVQLGKTVGFDANRVTAEGNFFPDALQAEVAKPTGVVLHPETSLTVTTNGASVNNVASSANGGRANLHVTATASGDYALKVQDSPDDSAWADLITFVADGSAIISEEGTVTGTVDQYTRLQATRTAGDTTPVVTFSRN